MTTEEVDNFLMHYGKKGMKWGVINEDKLVGKNGTPAQKKALNDANRIFATKAETMRKKYGPSEKDKNSSPKDHRLSDEQKSTLKKVAVGAAAGGAVIGGLYLGNKVLNNRPARVPYKPFVDTRRFTPTPEMEALGKIARDKQQNEARDWAINLQLNSLLKGSTPTPALHAFWKDHIYGTHKVSLDELSDVGIDLPIGHILKRVSTEAETGIKPGGFFAASQDSDVERYKAVMPLYWKQWGYAAEEGHIVNIVAKNGIKAPSPKQTLELYREWTKGRPLQTTSFYEFTSMWNNVHDAEVQSFFKVLVSKGYNAVVDLNDAGGIAESPLRILSSDGFDIKSVEKLSIGAIRAAQEKITVLEHDTMRLGIDFADIEPNELLDNFLMHYGKKGMKWGVINEDKSVGGTRAQKKALDEANKIFATKAETMRKKYGPAETNKDPSPKDHRLSDGQKSALKKVAIGGAVIGGLYLSSEILNKYGQDFLFKAQLGDVPKPMYTFWKDHLTVPHAAQLDKLSDVSIDLPKGHILKRVSTEAESIIKHGGFYAAFEDSDVERYKAVLPVYWKRWGYNAKEGHVVNIIAKNGVKAPSPKQTLELFNEFSKRHDVFTANDYASFYGFAHLWADQTNPYTISFFKLLVSKGYNAVVDLNDAGGLAKTPLRMLTSDGFEVGSVEKLTKETIRAAQEKITILEHAAMLLGIDFTGMKPDELLDNILMHYGKEQNHRKKLSDEDLVKYVEHLQKNKKRNALIHKDLEYGRIVTKRILEESGKTVAIGILQQI